LRLEGQQQFNYVEETRIRFWKGRNKKKKKIEASIISFCSKRIFIVVIQQKDVFKSHVFQIHRSPDRDRIELFPPMER